MVSRIFRPPALGRLRLACIDDAPIILELLNESMSKTFKITDTPEIVYLIENSILSVCQLDVNDDIVGFLAVRDYPLIPSVHPMAWEEYVWGKYKAIELNSRNTLFIHLLCWNSMYARECVDSLLKSIFMHDPYIHYIAMIKSLVLYPLLVPGQSRSEASFRRITPMERGVQADILPPLCIADRSEVSPRLRIRRAVEEDNDDIIPIIERHSAMLRQLYGEFYISELISRHPESERVLLVCEHKELAVGVMCLNTQVNYEALEESFELSPFGGLRHLACTNHKCSKDVESNVTWLFEENAFKDFHAESTTLKEVLNLLEDEEEMEFDIINIDTDLLRVPELLSYDALGRGPAESVMKIIGGRNSRKNSITDDKLKKDKPRTAAVTSMYHPPEPIRYSGTPNAFLLEVFAMHPDYDERYGFDMLEVAYELFPDKDFCVVCLPSNLSSFPLLEHFTLVTPYCSRLRFVNESLYVAHVNSIRGNLRVRPGEASDLQYLNDILEHAPRAQNLFDLFESTFLSYTLKSYVLLSQNQPIGMAVLGPLEDGTAIRIQYNLEPEPRRPGTDGTILAGVVSPVFEPHNRWFMRELLRRSQYSTFFWISRLFAKGDASPNRNLMSLAGHMMPVLPRNSVPDISGNEDLAEFFKDIATPFALWVLEKPLTSLPKVYVNNSIVVIGASRTGLAFLETLLMGPSSQYLTFSNVTLVSEHGLPTVTECLRAADTCVPKDGRYTDRYLKSVPFYFYLDVISALMVTIDRKKKCIHLKGGGIKYYDELVLTCGQQFQHPDYLSESLELVKEVQKGKPCERILMDNPKYVPDRVPPLPEMPENVMLINSLFEANICLRKLLHMITGLKDEMAYLNEENQVVVYGQCIEVYSCIAALLELGLSPNLIALVEPFPPEDTSALRVNCFNNETVDERVQETLEKLGIRILRQCSLIGWRQIENRVEVIHLMSPLHAICLPCFALFYYGLKAIDLHAFKAINECGLVYDGGLVVGPAFETNDPHIFGAGTCTNYSRRLYASRKLHRYYCSEDIGEALARIFLKKLDPFLISNPDVDSSMELLPKYSSSILTWQPVISFESPIVQSATLPGPLYYMKVRKPGIEIPMEVQLSLPRQGHTLLTDKNGNYFRVQLNVLHCVDAVTCLSKKSFSSVILSQLYGKHEAFFNKLLTRYQMNLIDDMYEYFTQPWMSAMYQETFSNLLADINEQDVSTVYDLVKSRYMFYDESTLRDSLSQSQVFSSTCSDNPNCGEPKQLGTFRSVVDRFVARTSSEQIECGQSDTIRKEASRFWKSIGGEKIVIAHLARYLNRNGVTNPHYAVPNRKFI
ncbi:hypothetical protein K1T71_008372 [Dendrolimus kikuchii]|uniref:Uncharacterized protein n=1 Tax=Dendrolimus kikuchii TaxID=765133 RepID=A0ACC1CX18_9NEOP|nr:hypothetical protein K1T71_008372 [Dendrolimus kikuchii]